MTPQGEKEKCQKYEDHEWDYVPVETELPDSDLWLYQEVCKKCGFKGAVTR